MRRSPIINHYARRTRTRYCKHCGGRDLEIHKIRTSDGPVYACDTCRTKRIAAMNAASIAKQRGTP